MNNIRVYILSILVLATNLAIIEGLSGSGVTSDTRSDNLQDLIDATPENGTLIIPEGEYYGTYYINRSIKLSGSENVTIIPKTSHSYHSLNINAKNVRIGNMTFIGHNYTEGNGIRVTGGSYISMNNISFYNMYYPVYITNSNDIFLDNINVKNTSVFKFEYVDNCRLFEINTYYEHYTINERASGIECSDSSNVTIERCNISLGTLKLENIDGILKDTTYSSNFPIGYNSLGINNIENNTFLLDMDGLHLRSNNSIFKNNIVMRKKEVNDVVPIVSIYLRKHILFLNNTFENISFQKGVGPSTIMNSKFVNNRFINAGLMFYTFPEGTIFENNLVDGKPLIVMENVEGVDIPDDFGQVFLRNCSNVNIRNGVSGLKDSEYPLLNIFECKEGLIDSVTFNGKDRPVRLEDSEDIVLGNCFLNTSLGMLVTGGFGHEFSGNWFWPGPGNFSDNSGSSWDDGEKGNFWIALDLKDEDGDGISEDAVSIPGGSSKDRFPLVPGLDLSLIVPYEMTTGEEFNLTCRAIPRIFDLKRDLSLHYSNGTNEIVVDLDMDMFEHNVTFWAPSNSTDDLVFWLNASLVLGGYMESERHTSRVLDNDAPEITVVEHQEEVENGSEVRFRLLVHDNVGTENVWCHITRGYETEVMNLSRNGSYWDLVFITSPEPCERYSIVFHANDTSGNRVFTKEMILRSLNSTFPFHFDDMTSNVTETGDILTFSASISGIFTISSVIVEYSRGIVSGTISTANVSGVFSCGLDVEPDSVLPIEYRWCVTDLSGNEYYTYPSEIVVLDTIDPTIDPGPYPDEVGTGSTLALKFKLEDNIEVAEISGYVTINGIPMFSFSEEEFVFSVPLNLTGDLVVSVDVSDPSGNVANWTSDVIFIRDTIDPEFTFTGNLSSMVNEVFRLIISASDNIGIAYINWSLGDIPGSGDLVEHVFDVEGSYPVRIEVTDTSGNIAVYEDTVSVTLPDDDGNTSSDRDRNWIYLLIVILSLCVLLIVTFFVARVVRKGPDGEEE